jgi:hypothetical protein
MSEHAAAAADGPGEPYEVLIEQGKIREFAQAAQADDLAYQGPDAVIPPTFLITASSWAPPHARADVGFDRKRLLHGEQEFRFLGPLPRAGDTLTAREHVAETYEKEGARGGTMRFAVVVTEFRSPAGDLVAEARRTLIERAAPQAAPEAAS